MDSLDKAWEAYKKQNDCGDDCKRIRKAMNDERGLLDDDFPQFCEDCYDSFVGRHGNAVDAMIDEQNTCKRGCDL